MQLASAVSHCPGSAGGVREQANPPKACPGGTTREGEETCKRGAEGVLGKSGGGSTLCCCTSPGRKATPCVLGVRTGTDVETLPHGCGGVFDEAFCKEVMGAEPVANGTDTICLGRKGLATPCLARAGPGASTTVGRAGAVANCEQATSLPS